MTDTNEALASRSSEDRCRELYDVATAMLGDAKYVEVVAGDPSEVGNDFSAHYMVTHDYDNRTGQRIAQQIKIEPVGGNKGVPSGWISVNLSGTLARTEFERVSDRYGRGVVMHENIDASYQAEALLATLTQGRVVDPTKEVVIDRAPDNKVNKGLPIRRIYKKRGLKLVGRRAIDTGLGFILQD